MSKHLELILLWQKLTCTDEPTLPVYHRWLEAPRGYYLGRTPDLIKHYPDEALLEEIRRAAELVGKPVLTMTDFTKLSGLPSSTLKRRFGSWRSVLESAGVGHMYSGEAEIRHTDEEMLEEIRRVAGIVGKPTLKRTDFSKYSRIGCFYFKQRFGSWQATLDRAGLGHLYTGKRGCLYTDEELLKEVQRVAVIVQEPLLSSLLFRKHSKINTKTLTNRFGGWSETLKRAGLERMDFQLVVAPLAGSGYPKDVILEEIRRVARLVEEPVLTQARFLKHTRIHPFTIAKKLGGWHAALELAGVGHRYFEDKPTARRRGELYQPKSCRQRKRMPG